MQARFDNGLSAVDQLILTGLLATASMVMFPAQASAYDANKTGLVLEIKNIDIATTPFKIPTPLEIHQSMSQSALSTAETQTGSIMKVAEITQAVPMPEPVKARVYSTAKMASYSIPPKTTDKVYMHEPEIREYICPKLGDKCDIFIAILKAENGTHECTRDNRGLNRNGSIDVGLAQINWNSSSPYTIEQLRDCRFNLDIALKKYETRGFRPWVAYTSGSYLRHLSAMTN
jgi:hypothetical protein